MILSRRGFFKIGGIGAAAAAFSACSALGEHLASGDLPSSLAIPANASLPLRFLNRAGYGPRPGDLAEAADMGLAALLEKQLAPDSIGDTASDLLVRHLYAYHMDIGQLINEDPKDTALELGTAVAGRAVYSKRQLYEAMVEFWSDHFNIYVGKNQYMLFLKIVDDRDVIRPHALGKFRDLLLASAHSPAMIVYLDNIVNVKAWPNENYARELMELHSLSVHGPYNQDDVRELSRALTGWSVERHGRREGQFFFNPDEHDFDPKRILGRDFPAGRGEEEVMEVLEMLVTHPSTARFIATKLTRHFVADEPPAGLVDRIAQVYLHTDGDIKSMLREIFLSPEFAAAPPKLKRPYAFMISALRALHCDVSGGAYRGLLGGWLRNMGQLMFHWPPPDGYPDISQKWVSTLLPRWNFSLALLNNQIDGVTFPLAKLIEIGGAQDVPSALDVFAGLTLNRPLDEQAQAMFGEYVGNGSLDDEAVQQRLKEAIALMLASPAFQWI